MTDSLDPKDHFSPRQCDVMRDQLGRRDEEVDNLREVMKYQGRAINRLLKRVRALDGWDHESWEN